MPRVRGSTIGQKAVDGNRQRKMLKLVKNKSFDLLSHKNHSILAARAPSMASSYCKGSEKESDDKRQWQKQLERRKRSLVYRSKGNRASPIFMKTSAITSWNQASKGHGNKRQKPIKGCHILNWLPMMTVSGNDISSVRCSERKAYKIGDELQPKA